MVFNAYFMEFLLQGFKLKGKGKSKITSIYNVLWWKT